MRRYEKIGKKKGEDKRESVIYRIRSFSGTTASCLSLLDSWEYWSYGLYMKSAAEEHVPY